jgi:hypothetical protein
MRWGLDTVSVQHEGVFFRFRQLCGGRWGSPGPTGRCSLGTPTKEKAKHAGSAKCLLRQSW